jgi:exopolysaccharide biosynthesis polyprenyl glycosylphosphotransferase
MLIVLDVSMLVLAFGLGHKARQILPLFPIPDRVHPIGEYIPTMILHLSLIVVMMYLSRLYHPRRSFSRIDLFREVTAAVTIGTVIGFGLQDLLFRNSAFEVDYPRSMFFYVWMFSVVLVVTAREAHRVLVGAIRRRGIARDNLLVVGTDRITRDLIQKIEAHPELGYNIVGVVGKDVRTKIRFGGVPYVGVYNDLPELIDNYQIEQVIIAMSESRRTEIADLVTLCQRGRVDIKIYPDMFSYIAGDMNVDELGGTPLLTVRDIALRGWRLSVKRGLDLFGSVTGLIMLSPFMLLTAALIRFESPGPIFYAQVRMGLDGRPFPMIKFRSMRVDAEVSGPGWTRENDPRVTRIGRFIRSTNWDEIPQLINVLLGHMSLVGPRPERPVYVYQFREQIPRYMERHREKAGMTGWAQVNGLRGDTSIAERTTFDLWYVENWSLWLDLKIIIRTVWQTLARSSKNAY